MAAPNPVPPRSARSRWPVWWQWATVASTTTVLAGALTRCEPAVWAGGLVLGAAALVAGTRMWRAEQRPALCRCGLGTKRQCDTEPWGCGPGSVPPPVVCAGCIACGGPDCIERPESDDHSAPEGSDR